MFKMYVNIKHNAGVISSVLNYELAVMREAVGPRQMGRYYDKSYEVLSQSFGRYLDSKAIANPKALHHVYEWNAVGTKRLWIMHRSPAAKGFVMSYAFLRSTKKAPIVPILKVPGPSGLFVTKTYVFRNKAAVMESGMAVNIKPKGKNRIAFPKSSTLTGVGFTRGTLRVNNPGGPQTTLAFQKSFYSYFASGAGTKALKSSGVLDSPARKAKQAGTAIPPSIRIKGNMSLAAAQAEARAAIERTI